MAQSILIPLGRTLASAVVTVPASADDRAKLILFGEQRSWNAGIQVRRLVTPVFGEGPFDFLKSWEGATMTLPGPGEYEVVRLESQIPLGVVYETGTDTAATYIDANAPALTTASVIYTRDTGTGDFKSPCSTNGSIHVRVQQLPTLAATIVSVSTGVSFTAFPSQAGDQVTVANSTNHMLEYRRGTGGSAARLPPGEQRTIALPTGNANGLQWRAVGATSNVLVTGDVTMLGTNGSC